MAHENVCALQQQTLNVRCLIYVRCLMHVRVHRETAARRIACMRVYYARSVLYSTYARNITNLRTLTLFIAPRYQQACRITHVFKRKTLRRRSHCRGGSGLLS